MMRKSFQNVAFCALIAASDIAGFAPAACHIVLRDQISDEGDVGTVDANYFLCWVKTCLCPALGDFSKKSKKKFAKLVLS